MTRNRLLAVAWASIAVAILFLRPHPTPGPLLRDFEAYWAAGSTWNAHGDPYGRAIWNAERGVTGVNDRRDEVLPFVGPPATLVIWSLFARLSFDRATLLWSAILVAFLVALVVAAVRGSGASLAPTPFLAALALALSFGPVTSDVALGQFALPAFVGAMFVVLAAPSLPAATAAACLAFMQTNASLGLASQLGRNRTTEAMLVGAVAAYLAGALAAGWHWPLAYASALAAHVAAERFAAIQITPASIAYGLGAAPFASTLVGVAAALFAVAGAIAIAIGVRDAFPRFIAFSALIPFVAGFFHEHDLVVAYGAAVWCALRTRGAARMLALAGTLLVAVDWFGLAQRPTGIAQSALLALAAFCAFLGHGDAGEPRAFYLFAPAFAAVFAVAALTAAQHPAPVWPDALGTFHAPVAASIAAVWSQEQRSSGLLALNPAWALLRSLSLVGCALLAYAIYRHSSCCRTA